jgi:hypothetical protein
MIAHNIKIYITCISQHYFKMNYIWYCPVYAPMRQQMIGRLVAETDIEIDNTNIVSILINGEIEKENHIKIYNIITDYIRNTKRFI